MDFDDVALARKKSEYVVMRDLTEHHGQNKVPLKLPVEKVEVAEKEVPHDDCNCGLVLLVLILIED
jgi:hypothetical protein